MAISNGAGVKQYVQLIGRGVIGVRPKTASSCGATTMSPTYGQHPHPHPVGDYVFTSAIPAAAVPSSSSGRKATALRRKKSVPPAGELQNHHGGMVMIGDYIYVGATHNDGYPVCVNAKTGDIVGWRNEDRKANAGGGSAAVAYADATSSSAIKTARSHWSKRLRTATS